MIVTEEEAAEKWCPHVRYVIGPDNSRWHGGTYTTRLDDLKGPLSMCCIGSRCMAWRWSGKYRFDDGMVVSANVGGDLTPVGYCGIAEKPEMP